MSTNKQPFLNSGRFREIPPEPRRYAPILRQQLVQTADLLDEAALALRSARFARLADACAKDAADNRSRAR
jgi:hypothetical protein